MSHLTDAVEAALVGHNPSATSEMLGDALHIKLTVDALPSDEAVREVRDMTMQTVASVSPGLMGFPFVTIFQRNGVTMTVEVGQRYRHTNGHTYRVIAIAREADLEVDFVIYQADDSRDALRVWARSMANFTGCRQAGVKRFELLP